MSLFADLIKAYSEGEATKAWGPDWRLKLEQLRATTRNLDLEGEKTKASTAEIGARTQQLNDQISALKLRNAELTKRGIISPEAEKELNDLAIQKATAAHLQAQTGKALHETDIMPSAPEATAARQAALEETKAHTGYWNRMPHDTDNSNGGQVSIYNGRPVTAWKYGLLRDTQTGEIIRPLNAAGEDKKATLEGMVQDVHTVEQMAANHLDQIGPVQGRLAGVKALFVGNDAETNFIRRTVQNLADQLLRARSGAQINEQEYARLRTLVPNVNSPDEKFLQDVALFRTELERTLQMRYGGGTPGHDLGAQPVPTPGVSGASSAPGAGANPNDPLGLFTRTP